MVKVWTVETSEHIQTINLFSDERSEIVDVDMETGEMPGVEIVGWKDGYRLKQGDSVMTSSSEMAFLKSDGTWNWG